jgi:N-acetylglucosamine kinase-like BadF-type ATPase
MMLYMGIDGGGSNLRVVIVDEQMQIRVTVQRGTANPRIIGQEQSALLIQDALREAFAQVTEPVRGVGIGIAGASAVYARAWLHEVIHAVLPDVHVAAGSDYEIALVGANGTREGVLLLAGTGSVAFGVNAAGQSLQVGGWGYLLGDEGSGYWIGMQALQVVTKIIDGQLPVASTLKQRIMDELQLTQSSDILAWVYGQKPTPVASAAQLSSLVLTEAQGGDTQAQMIITAAADHLVHLAQTTMRQLDMIEPKIAFAGGLLESQNLLSAQVIEKLGLPQHPQAKYPPMVGAALLAQLTLDTH